VIRAGKGTEVNNYASLIYERHYRGTKAGPNKAEIRPQLTTFYNTIIRATTLYSRKARAITADLTTFYYTIIRATTLCNGKARVITADPKTFYCRRIPLRRVYYITTLPTTA
jgi:hypothetical protein